LYLNSFTVVAQPLVVGMTHLPPFFVVGSDGSVSGTLTDLLKRTLSDANLPYVLESYPPKRLYENVAAGATDLTIGIREGNPRSDSPVIYSKFPVASIELRIYALKSTVLPSKIEGLIGRKLGLIRGFQYGTKRQLFAHPENSPRPVDINTHENALAMLVNGRIDFLLDYKEPVSSAIRKDQEELLHHLTLQSFDMYFTLSKGYPGAPEILKILENTYSRY